MLLRIAAIAGMYENANFSVHFVLYLPFGAENEVTLGLISLIFISKSCNYIPYDSVMRILAKSIIQCLSSDRYAPNRSVLRFFRKLSTKNTTKLEHSSNRYVFFNISVTIFWLQSECIRI